MNPVLFRIAGFPVSSYYLMVMLAIVTGFFMVAKESDRLGLERDVTVNAAIVAAIAGVIGARIQHVIFDGFFPVYLQKPLAMFYIWKGGLAVYGGVIFALFLTLVYLHLKKKPLLKYLDMFSYPVALGMAFGRVGCYLNGCCFGKISSSCMGVRFLKWGISAKNQFKRDIILDLSNEPFPVINTQLISVFFNLLIFVFLYFFVRRRYRKSGVPLGTWLVLYSIFRFIIEMFRADDRGMFFNNMLSTSQIVAVLTFAAGILLIFLPSDSAGSSS